MSGNEPGKQWWQVSRLMPAGKVDMVLLCCGGAAVVLLVIAIVGFTVASARGSRLAAAEATIKALETKGVPSDVTAKIERLEREVGTAKSAQEASERQVKELADKLREASALSEQLAQSQQDKAALEKKMQALNAEKERLAQTLTERAAEIRNLDTEKKRLEREAGTAEALRNERDRLRGALDYKEKEIADLKWSVRSGSAEMAQLKRDSEARLAELQTELEESRSSIKTLTTQLADFPKTPLPEEEATRRFEATKAKVEAIKVQDIIADHDRRIETWLMAKRVLAGTKCEHEATSNWEREKKQKQADIDNAAALLHGQTLQKIKEHADEYDRNIKMLSDILLDVHMKMSPRNVKAVEGSIAQQERAKQAAFDRAAAAIYKEVVTKNREEPEAYASHIRRLEEALPSVQNSPRYVAVIKDTIEKEKKLRAAAEARAAPEGAW